ncbi:hypothetical protein SAMN02746019_00021500 [Thermoflexus hugenholtzii JAD2]|uniref:TY-Chap N-terminal domain-containing protein n=2 Tax=Thermoflexus TaxID=1495649 RepID=A0A212PWT1_9CHLR|nr:hypothetical protein SAMN02746019_00021500 [Thermoflexus hugenholtzii JAD2]
MKASTPETRIQMFREQLRALMEAPPGSAVVFEIPGRPLAYVQLERTPEGLRGEVCSGDWGPRRRARPLPRAAQERLRGMGWILPPRLREQNPFKPFSPGDPEAIAQEIERIFREIYQCPPDYTVRTEGVLHAKP